MMRSGWNFGDIRQRGGLVCIWAMGWAAWFSAPVGGATLTFQEGVSGYSSTVDTFLSENDPATSKGAVTVVEWDGDEPATSGRSNFGLIRFDDIFGAGVGQIPPGSQITSATLTYTVNNAGNSGELYEVAVTWGETVTYNGFGVSAGVQAADYSDFVNLGPGTAGEQNLNVTASIAKWVDSPGDNRGWIALPTGTNGVEFRSSEYATVAERPKLTVVINEGPPAIALVRQPYLQTGTPTSMTVCWRTDTATDSRVRYGDGPVNLTETVTDGTLATDHFVEISGLTAGTTYFYDIGTTTAVLAGGDSDHYFITSPTAGTSTPFTAWIVGDSGTGGANQANVRNAMLTETVGDPPDIFIHVGDMAYDGGEDLEFTNNFYTPYATILNHTVCWPTLGNHEAANSDSPTQSGPYYEGYVLPTGGEAGGMNSGTEAYYSFDYANVHFICLDSHDTDRTPGQPMLNWLTLDLGATSQEWIVAFWHHPPYTKGSHDSDNVGDSGGRMRDMREDVLPILEAAGVDLVLAGHSHIYERSYLIDGAYDTPTTAAGHIVDMGDGKVGSNGPYFKPNGLSGNKGAVYVVAGHGGQGVSGTGGHPVMYFDEVDNGSCLMTVDGNVMHLRNVRDDGVISDEFYLVKGASEADCDGDGDVDGVDFAKFASCYNMAGNPPRTLGCSAIEGDKFDFDGDADVDGLDFATFASCFNKAGNPPRTAGCPIP
jgi:hypothetical protein